MTIVFASVVSHRMIRALRLLGGLVLPFFELNASQADFCRNHIIDFVELAPLTARYQRILENYKVDGRSYWIKTQVDIDHPMDRDILAPVMAARILERARDRGFVGSPAELLQEPALRSYYTISNREVLPEFVKLIPLVKKLGIVLRREAALSSSDPTAYQENIEQAQQYLVNQLNYLMNHGAFSLRTYDGEAWFVRLAQDLLKEMRAHNRERKLHDRISRLIGSQDRTNIHVFELALHQLMRDWGVAKVEEHWADLKIKTSVPKLENLLTESDVFEAAASVYRLLESALIEIEMRARSSSYSEVIATELSRRAVGDLKGQERLRRTMLGRMPTEYSNDDERGLARDMFSSLPKLDSHIRENPLWALRQQMSLSEMLFLDRLVSFLYRKFYDRNKTNLQTRGLSVANGGHDGLLAKDLEAAKNILPRVLERELFLFGLSLSDHFDAQRDRIGDFVMQPLTERRRFGKSLDRVPEEQKAAFIKAYGDKEADENTNEVTISAEKAKPTESVKAQPVRRAKPVKSKSELKVLSEKERARELDNATARAQLVNMIPGGVESDRDYIHEAAASFLEDLENGVYSDKEFSRSLLKLLQNPGFDYGTLEGVPRQILNEWLSVFNGRFAKQTGREIRFSRH